MSDVLDVNANFKYVKDPNREGHHIPIYGPLLKGTITNTVKAQNEDFFATALTPTLTPALFKVNCVLSNAATLVLRVGSVSIGLNSGGLLTANALYKDELLVNAGDTINFRTDSIGGTTVVRMSVIEDVDYLG
jgi:hypothetical protein